MARKPSTVAQLARTLNRDPRPVCVFDEEMVIVFLNRACREWLGPDADGLLGTRAAYHSSPDAEGPAAVAAGLCPSPEVLDGRQRTGEVYHTTRDGRVLRRRGEFMPIGFVGSEPLLIVGLLGSEDLSEAESSRTEYHSVPHSTLPTEAVPEELHGMIRRFRQDAAGRYGADRLVGVSPASARARRQVELAADCRASVLLVGPPGSGRQHVASAIHYAGDPDQRGTLIPLDCAVLGPEMIESAVRAAASGEGLGAAADRSTLLLSSVDRLPREGQPALATVFEDRSQRLRLIGTSERPPAELVRAGAIREDLVAALSTITIELPPLAQRREDLPLLAQLFVEDANLRAERQLAGLTLEALDRLDAYLWPGNLDELAGVIAEAHARAEGPNIDVDDLPERFHRTVEAAARPPRVEETIVLDEFLGHVERELVERALARAKGNKAQAARLLGMTRPRLYRRLEQLGPLDEAP